MAEAEAIGRHRQAVFEQRDPPRDYDRFPERPVVTVFQVPVPGEGHEDVRKTSRRIVLTGLVLLGSVSKTVYRVFPA